MRTTPIQFRDESPVSRRFREMGAIAVRISIVWFISAMLMALVASAAETEPVRDADAPSVRIENAQQFITATSAQVLSAVDHERDAIRRNPGRAYAIVNDIVGRRVDIERVSRLVLGKYWRTATRAQRERLKSAFLKTLIRTYVTGISQQVAVILDGERPEITYLSSTISEDGPMSLYAPASVAPARPRAPRQRRCIGWFRPTLRLGSPSAVPANPSRATSSRTFAVTLIVGSWREVSRARFVHRAAMIS